MLNMTYEYMNYIKPFRASHLTLSSTYYGIATLVTSAVTDLAVDRLIEGVHGRVVTRAEPLDWRHRGQGLSHRLHPLLLVLGRPCVEGDGVELHCVDQQERVRPLTGPRVGTTDHGAHQHHTTGTPGQGGPSRRPVCTTWGNK